MARGELGSRRSIEGRTEDDARDKDARVDRGDVQVEDAEHVATAGERVELAGTDEGAAEVQSGLEQGLNQVKDVHGDHVGQAEVRFEQVRETEVELGDRSGSSERDASAIRQEASGMSSPDTTAARAEVERAADAGTEDARFLREASDKEQETREAGSRSMQEQAQRIASMRIRGR